MNLLLGVLDHPRLRQPSRKLPSQKFITTQAFKAQHFVFQYTINEDAESGEGSNS